MCCFRMLYKIIAIALKCTGRYLKMVLFLCSLVIPSAC